MFPTMMGVCAHISSPKVVLHQPEYAGPWEQGGSLLSPNDKRIGDEVVLGGLEYAFEDSDKDVSSHKVVLQQEACGPKSVQEP